MLLAVVVTFLASAASVRLFIDGSRNDWRETREDSDIAGRADVALPDEPEIVNPAPEPITVVLRLDRPARIASFLAAAGLGTADAKKWAWLLNQGAGITDFGGGHSLTLYKDPGTGDLRGLKYNLNDRVAVREVTYGEGVTRTNLELIRYVLQPVAVSFRLSGNFWREARRNDIPQTVVATLDYAFRERRPLASLPRGSTIKLIYQEKVSRDGGARYVTGLQAAEIGIGSKTLTALAFRDEDGHARLYDRNGAALGREALHYPLNFEYISSGFSLHRYHPILHQYRSHAGVDLVARYGTPVKAVADGRVETAGWCGELGRCVRLQHEGGIVSIYGHLSDIPRRIRDGASVYVGEVIGRVGSSGLSTGPHLHYALEEDGRYVNPLTATIGERHQVSPRMRALFDHFKQYYLAVFSRLPAFKHRFTVNRALPMVSAETEPGVTTAVEPHRKAPRRRRLRVQAARDLVETVAVATIIGRRASVMW